MIRSKEKYYAFLSFASILFYSVTVLAQSPSHPVKEVYPLTIGDTLPGDLVLTNVINYPAKTIRLADLKGKMILLDFWATWCTSCIEGFPKMDALQKEFTNELQVILVNAAQTEDDEQKANKLFAKRKEKAGYDVTLPYVIGDTILQALFPHKYVPNYVWVNKDGVVAAITFPQEVTRKNIRSLIKTGKVNIHTKKDRIEFNAQEPLFSNEMNEVGASLKYRSLLTGYIEGIGFKIGRVTNEENKINRYYILNYSIDYLYKDAFRDILKNLPNNRIVFDIVKKSNFKNSFFDRKNYENRYCYEIVTPGSTMEELNKYYVQDLIRNFGVTVKNERKKVKILIVKPSDKLYKIYTKGGNSEIQASDDGSQKFVRNISLSAFVGVLNSYITTPLIAESLPDKNIDIDLPLDFNTYTITQVKALLTKMGFSIKEETRTLDFAVFTDA